LTFLDSGFRRNDDSRLIRHFPKNTSPIAEAIKCAEAGLQPASVATVVLAMLAAWGQ
jgi:hypothetical protein